MFFLCETTQNDHYRMLYKFENDQKNLVVLGVVDMRQLLLKAVDRRGLIIELYKSKGGRGANIDVKICKYILPNIYQYSIHHDSQGSS